MRPLRTQGQIVSPESRELVPGRPTMRFGLRTLAPPTIHSCCAWGDVAERMGRLTEGDMVEVVARPSTRTYVGRKPLTEWVVTEYKLLKTKP